MLRDVTARLLDQRAACVREVTKACDVRFVNITGSIEGGTTTFLAFVPGRAEPIFVVKVQRHRDGESFESEYRALHRLAKGPRRIADAVPQAILCESIEGHSTLVLSVVAGQPMMVPRGPDGGPEQRSAERRLAGVLGWLADMNRAFRDRSGEATADARARALALAAALEETFVLTAGERLLLDTARTGLDSALRHGTFLQHGDFSRHNVLVHDTGQESIGVIDWTGVTGRGLALHDLLFFLITYFLQMRSEPGVAGIVDAFGRTFLLDGPRRAYVMRHLHAHAAALDIAQSDIPSLMTWFLAERAVVDAALISRCVSRGSYPRFALAAAASVGASRRELPQQQFWIELFRAFARAPEALVA